MFHTTSSGCRHAAVCSGRKLITFQQLQPTWWCHTFNPHHPRLSCSFPQVESGTLDSTNSWLSSSWMAPSREISLITLQKHQRILRNYVGETNNCVLWGIMSEKQIRWLLITGSSSQLMGCKLRIRIYAIIEFCVFFCKTQKIDGQWPPTKCIYIQSLKFRPFVDPENIEFMKKIYFSYFFSRKNREN